MKRLHRTVLFRIGVSVLIGLFAMSATPVRAFSPSGAARTSMVGLERAGSGLRDTTYDFVDATLIGAASLAETGGDILSGLRTTTYAFTDATIDGLMLIGSSVSGIGRASQDVIVDTGNDFVDGARIVRRGIAATPENSHDAPQAIASVVRPSDEALFDGSTDFLRLLYIAFGEESVRSSELLFASGIGAFDLLSAGFESVLGSINTAHRLTTDMGYQFGRNIGEGFLALGTYPEEIWYQSESLVRTNRIIVDTGLALQESGRMTRNAFASLSDGIPDQPQTPVAREVEIASIQPIVMPPLDITPDRLIANASTALGSWWGTIVDGIDSAIAVVVDFFSDDDTFIVQETPTPSVPTVPTPSSGVVTTFVPPTPPTYPVARNTTTNIYTTQYLSSTGGGVSLTQLALAIIGLRDELEPQIELAMRRPRSSDNRSGGGNVDSEELEDYLPLVGGTLTGGLGGTDATFSGDLAAATLTITGSTTFNGVDYLFPSVEGGAGTFLMTDGNGNLTWDSAGSGSGTVSVGTAGALAFYPTATSTVDDAANLFYDSGMGNLGIGTSSPYAKLSVVGPVVAEYFHATASNATSTFNGAINIPATTAAGAGMILQAGTRFIHSAGGIDNFFAGTRAGNATTTGGGNTAVGFEALMRVTSGGESEAIGWRALNNSTIGYQNVAIGNSAMFTNISGGENVAVGYGSLFDNVSGYGNVALGLSAASNTTGSENTGVGYLTLTNNTTGTGNTVLGSFADVSSGALTNATAIGYNARVAASNSLVLGGTGGNAVKVGIGTTTPYATLSVVGDVAITGGLYDSGASLGSNGMVLQSTGTGLDWVATSSLGFGTGTVGSGTTGQLPYYAANGTTLTASSSIFLATSGNVGIGTTTPAYLLHVVGSTAAIKVGDATKKALALHAGSGGSVFEYDSAGFFGILSNTNASVGAGTGVVQFQIAGGAPSGSLNIVSSGNVGIGTTSPYAKLSVTNTDSSPSFVVEDSASPDSTPFIVDASGNVGIGTSSPSALLALSATAGSNLLRFAQPGSSVGQSTFSLDSDGTLVLTTPDGSNDSTGEAQFSITNIASGAHRRLLQLNNLSNGPTFEARRSGVSQLLVDATNNIGIGTTTPHAKLSIHANVGDTNTTLLSIASSTASATTTLFSVTNVGNVTSAGSITAGGQILAPNGTGAAPGFAFSQGATTMGIYRQTAGQLHITANGGSTFTQFNANGFLVGDGVSGAPFGTPVIDILKNSIHIIGSNSSANLIDKNFRMGVRHYDNTEEAVALIRGDSQLAANILSLGGGDSGMNAATELRFYTAAATTTLTGTQRMTIDSGGNVGIATTSPYAKLSIAGDVAVTGGLYDNNATRGSSGQVLQSTGTGLAWVSTSTLGFGTGTVGTGTTGQLPYYAANGTTLTATSSLFLATSGNVGIGTTTPLAKLHVVGTNTGAIIDGSTAQDSVAVLTIRRSDLTSRYFSFIPSDAGFGSPLITGSGRIGFDTGLTLGGASRSILNVNSSLPLVLDGNGGNILLSTSGNVGIGTTTPASKLTVDGTIQGPNNLTISSFASGTWINMPTTGPSGIGNGGAGSNAWIAYAASGGQWFNGSAVGDLAYRNTGGKLLFGNTAGAPAMTISGDNVGIGTITPTSARLMVQGVAGTANIFELASSTGANVFTVTGAGNVGIGTTSPYAKLSVVGPVVAEYFHATSTTATSTFGGAINISTTASNGAGVIFQNGTRFIHSYGTRNFFAGANAGNFTNTGTDNTAVGGALSLLTSGTENVAIGNGAMRDTAGGSFNVAIGASALLTNTSGLKNVAIGEYAGQIGTANDSSVFIGYNARTSGGSLTNAIAIGQNAIVGASNSLVLGGTGADAVKVGIATTTPYATLSVVGDVAITGGLYDNAASRGLSGYLLQSTGTGLSWVATSSLGITAASSTTGTIKVGWPEVIYCNVTNPALGDVAFYLGEDVGGETYYMAVWAAHYLRFTTATKAFAGYTGITTSNCNSSISQLTSDGKAKYFANGIGAVAQDADNDTKVMVEKNTDEDKIRFDTAGTERMIIDNTGLVGIGTTTPWRTLSVVGTVGLSSSLTSGTTGNYLCINTSTYEVTSGTTCSASSERFKENIVDLTYGLDAINALRPVTFRYKREYNPDGSTRLGLIAEEVNEVIPEVVNRDKNGLVESVSYDNLISLLIKGIQELSARLEAVEIQLAAAGTSLSTSFAHFTEILVDTFTVGSEDAPTGITLFDEITGEPYCLSVRNGETVTRAGECGEEIVEEPLIEEPETEDPPAEEAPIDEPPEEEPPQEEPPVDEPPAEDEPEEESENEPADEPSESPDEEPSEEPEPVI